MLEHPSCDIYQIHCDPPTHTHTLNIHSPPNQSKPIPPPPSASFCASPCHGCRRGVQQPRCPIRQARRPHHRGPRCVMPSTYSSPRPLLTLHKATPDASSQNTSTTTTSPPKSASSTSTCPSLPGSPPNSRMSAHASASSRPMRRENVRLTKSVSSHSLVWAIVETRTPH